VTREELIEVMVRRMAESECGPTSLHGHAYAALAALEAAGVRLVPSEATQEMTGAVLEPTASRYEVMKTYSDMIAASPYAPPGG